MHCFNHQLHSYVDNSTSLFLNASYYSVNCLIVKIKIFTNLFLSTSEF